MVYNEHMFSVLKLITKHSLQTWKHSCGIEHTYLSGYPSIYHPSYICHALGWYGMAMRDSSIYRLWGLIGGYMWPHSR